MMRVAVVTQGVEDRQKSIALKFAQAGAHVVIVDSKYTARLKFRSRLKLWDEKRLQCSVQIRGRSAGGLTKEDRKNSRRLTYW